MTDDTQNIANEQKGEIPVNPDYWKSDTHLLEDICESFSRAQKKVYNNCLDSKGLEALQETLYESINDKEKINDFRHQCDRTTINLYVEHYNRIIRPLMKILLILQGTKSETLVERMLNSSKSSQEEFHNLENRLDTQLYLKVKEKFRLYCKLYDLVRQTKTYEECMNKTQLQINEIEKAIPAKISGEDLSKVVNSDIFPEKCYQFDEKSLREYKEKLQVIYNEAYEHHRNLTINTIRASMRFELLETEIPLLKKEKSRIYQCIQHLERTEDNGQELLENSCEGLHSSSILEAAEEKIHPKIIFVCGTGLIGYGKPKHKDDAIMNT
jgi:hypothetical protein